MQATSSQLETVEPLMKCYHTMVGNIAPFDAPWLVHPVVIGVCRDCMESVELTETQGFIRT